MCLFDVLLLKCEPKDVRRRRVFKGKQPGEQFGAGLGYKILELVKLAVDGRP